MAILAINTASSKTAIAVLEMRTDAGTSTSAGRGAGSSASAGRVCLLTENSWQAENNEAEKLMPAIQKLFKKVGKTSENTAGSTPSKNTASDRDDNSGFESSGLANIDQVFVIKGPGSFTGLRIGITVANTIAYLNQCELFGINTFEYWHALSDLPVLIFAGSGGVYLCEKPGADAELVNIPDLNKTLKKKKIKKVFGDITDNQKSILAKDVEFIKFNETFGQIMRKIVAKSHKSVKIVEPLYIKKPSITVSRKICCI